MKCTNALGLGIALLPILFGSCVNQRKVTAYLNTHELFISEYCSIKFPVKETVDSIYKLDSSDYEKAYTDVLYYADSLLELLQKKPGTEIVYIDKEVSLDSLRNAIKRQLKKSLIPCIDSFKIITRTVENTARVVYLSGKVEEKEGVITERDKTITTLSKKVHSLNRFVWFFWILVLIIIGYVFLKVRYKFSI